MNARTGQITIEGVTYNIVWSRNADEAEAEGRVNIARTMRQNGVEQMLTLQRPRGRKLYTVTLFKNRARGRVLTVPSF